MRLTPEDVHNIAFGAPAEGLRGYNPEDVDVFVDLLEESVRLYREDIAGLEARVAELQARKPASALPVEVGPDHVALLLLPRHVVDQLLAQAQAESDRLLAEFTAQAARTGQTSQLHPAVAIVVVGE